MIGGGGCDASAWVGRWPFRVPGAQTVPALERLLAAHGLSGAVAAPLDAVLCPDPMLYNEPFLAAVRRRASGFRWLPAAVVDPTLGGFAEAARRCLALGARCFKVLPNYHLYPVVERGLSRAEALGVPWVKEAARGGLDGLDQLCRLAAGEGVPVSVQIRLQDERAQHPLMRVPPVPAAEVAELAARHPDCRFVVSGAYHAELAALGRSENIWVEISFVESEDTLAGAAAHVSWNRLLLGTHAPFFYPAVALAKVEAAGVGEDERRAVARGNAEGLWGPG